MTRLSTLLLATAMALPAAGALAEEHLVSIERYGYYPAKVYVQDGDTIRFVNNSPNWVSIYTTDYSDNLLGYLTDNPCSNPSAFSGSTDGFNIPWFSVGQERVIDVTSCIETQFYSPYIHQYSFNSSQRHNLIVFGTAPNG